MPVNTYITANGRIRRRVTTNGGAVTDQVAVVTNALGSVIATYKDGWLTADRSYDPYGETRAEWNDVGRFGWVGGLGYRATRREWVSHYVRARHYGFTPGMWTSVDPLWPSEPAFGYVGGRPLRTADATGLSVGFGGSIDGDCPPEVRSALNRLCAKLRQPWSASDRGRINDCIAKTSGKVGMHCPSLQPQSVNCLRNFCKVGTVKCDPLNGPCGRNPGFSGGQSCHQRRNSPVGIVVIDPIAHKNGGCAGISSPGIEATLLHEALHACGIAHGVNHKGEPRSGNNSCNGIAACCRFNVVVGQGPALNCWTKIRR